MKLAAYKPSVWTYGLMCFAVLCINKLGCFPTGGEECLTFAKQYCNPEWIPGSFSLDNDGANRFLFYFAFGHLLEILSFEQCIFAGRLINFFLYAIPLALIFKKLDLSLLEGFVVLQIFIWGRQAFFGGEWLFYTIEPKSFAYVFVLWSLYLLLSQKKLWAAVLLAVASYWHFLAGAWIAIGIPLYLFWLGRKKESILFSVSYGLLVLPLVIYLMGIYFGSSGMIETEPSADWIFCYFRLPNHLGIFDSMEYFLSYHGLHVALAAMCIAILLYFQLCKKLVNELIPLIIIFLSFSLIYVVIAYVDHQFLDEQCRLGLKYFPFRSSSIAYFLFHLVVLVEIKKRWGESKRYPLVLLLFSIAMFGVLIGEGIENVNRSRKSNSNPDYQCIISEIKEKTDSGDDFILYQIPEPHSEHYTFIRRSGRDAYFVNKFIPSTPQRLHSWYERSLNYDRFINDWRQIYEINKNMEDPIDFILSKGEISGLVEFLSCGDFKVYQL